MYCQSVLKNTGFECYYWLVVTRVCNRPTHSLVLLNVAMYKLCLVSERLGIDYCTNWLTKLLRLL